MGNFIKSYWEREAKGYCRTLPKDDEYRNIIKNVVNEILSHNDLRKSNIMELGSGSGYLLQGLAGTDNNVIGIDISGEMVKIAKKRLENSNNNALIMQMDAQELLFEDNSFELMVSDNLLWTLEFPQKAYEEWYRVLKPNGKLIIFDANWNLWRYDEKLYKEYVKYQNKLRKKYNRGTHIYKDYEKGEKFDQELYLSDKKRPEWDTNIMQNIGYKNIVIYKDVSNLVWDKMTLELNKMTLPFMICGEK